MRIYFSCILSILMMQTVFGSHMDSALELGQEFIKPVLVVGAFAASYAMMNRTQQSRPLCIPMPRAERDLDLSELDKTASTTLAQLKKDIQSATETSFTAQMVILKGPAGTGKTTIAQKLPQFLGLTGLRIPNFGGLSACYLPECKIQAEIDKAIQEHKKPILLFVDEIDSFHPNDNFWNVLMEKKVVVVGTTNNEKRKLSENKKVLTIDFLAPKLKEVIICNKMQELCINEYVMLDQFNLALPAKMTAAELDMIFKEIIKARAGSSSKEISQQDCVRGIYNANTYLLATKLRLSDMSYTTMRALSFIQNIQESQAGELNEIVDALNAIDSIPIQRAFYQSFDKEIQASSPPSIEELLNTINNILVDIRIKERKSIISICNKIYQCETTPENITKIYENIDRARPIMIDFAQKKEFFNHLIQVKKYQEDTMVSLLDDYQKHFDSRDRSTLQKREKVEKKVEPLTFSQTFSRICTRIKQSISLNIFSYLSPRNFSKVYNNMGKTPVFLIGVNAYLLHKMEMFPFSRS